MQIHLVNTCTAEYTSIPYSYCSVVRCFFKPIAMSASSLSPSFLLSLAITDFILGTLAVCGNLILLITILLDPLRCLRTQTTYLIANLALSDFAIGTFIGYSSAFMEYSMYFYNTAPNWINVAVNIGGGAALVTGIWTVIAMALDRYMAVTDPLHYSERVTGRRVLIFILLSWPVALTVPASFYPFAGQSWTAFLLVYSHTHFTVPVLLLFFVYFRIFRSLARRRCELIRLATSISTMTLRHTLERERKMALTTLTILVLFCVSFLPLSIKFQLLNFCKCSAFMPYKKLDLIPHTFLYFSSLLDPFIYTWRVPKFRRSVRVCIRMKARNAVRPVGTSKN